MYIRILFFLTTHKFQEMDIDPDDTFTLGRAPDPGWETEEPVDITVQLDAMGNIIGASDASVEVVDHESKEPAESTGRSCP